MNKFKIGTSIIGLMTPQAIYVGADGLSREVTCGQADAMQKIRMAGMPDFYFAMSGFLWEKNGVDMLYECFIETFSVFSPLSPEQRKEAFEARLDGFGAALIEQYPDGKMGEAIKINVEVASIETLIFGAHHGQLVAWLHRISFERDEHGFRTKVVLQGTLRNTEPPMWAILGHKSRARELCESKAEELGRTDPLVAVGYLLAAQTKASPEEVGPPFLIMRLSPQGEQDAYIPTLEQLEELYLG